MYHLSEILEKLFFFNREKDQELTRLDLDGDSGFPDTSNVEELLAMSCFLMAMPWLCR